jgi:hypothetical protein
VFEPQSLSTYSYFVAQDFFDDAEVDEKEEAEKRRQREKDMDKKLLKKIRDAEAAAKVAAEKAPKGDQIFEQDLVTLRVTLTRVCNTCWGYLWHLRFSFTGEPDRVHRLCSSSARSALSANCL